MASERWTRLEALFIHATGLDPITRAAYLAEECADDEPLRHQVEAMLAAHEEKGEAIERAIQATAGLVVEAESASAIGQEIGNYRVIDILGEGGMGEVFLAERMGAEFDQKVAIKLLSRNRLSPAVRERFRAEQQILANLHHPNIAPLLDGGTTRYEVPYLVMEYVDGEPIDVYCDRRKLSVTERLALFRDICSAVHYSHQNLVVHRDIKASNILVNADGMVKLLDFGIAKILGSESFRRPIAETMAEERLMTPEHASPEQVLGRSISTATDVYALGVLLFRLLTGRHPYEFRDQRPAEVERVICHETPTRPSLAGARPRAKQDRHYPSAVAIAAHRRTTPERLSRTLRGDLDNMLLKALRKEPERRYASAQQLSDDIERYLSGMPVRARKDTFVYRSGKFINRHPIGTAAGLVFALVLALFTTSLTIQAERLVKQRDAAERERQRAEQVAVLLEDLFSASDPDEARGREPTVREILDAGAGRIEEELAGQSQVQATLLERIGRVYLSIGRLDEAQHWLARSLEIRRADPGADQLVVAANLTSLAKALYETNDYVMAKRHLLKAEAIYRRELSGDDPRLAETYDELGWLLLRMEELGEAERYFKTALEMYRRVGGRRSADVARVLTNLAQVSHFREEFADAQAYYREALIMGRETLPENHPDLSDYLFNLGSILHARGELDEALKLEQEALTVSEQVFGADHPDVAIVLAGLGRLMQDRGELDAALGYVDRALAIDRARLGETHSNVGYHSVTRARILADMGELEAAGREFTTALEIYAQSLPREHAYVAVALAGLSQIRTCLGDAGSGERLAREALFIWHATRPADHWQTAVARSVLGFALARQDRHEEAEPILQETYAALAAKRGTQDRRTRAAASRLLDRYRREGRLSELADQASLLDVDPVNRVCVLTPAPRAAQAAQVR